MLSKNGRRKTGKKEKKRKIQLEKQKELNGIEEEIHDLSKSESVKIY